MTREEARKKALPGWNIRCNLCGEYPAKWFCNQRPDWGSLALCDRHGEELRSELEWHEAEMRRLRTINYEQDMDDSQKVGPLEWD